MRWREVMRGLHWKPLLLVSAGIFVLVMGTIVSMELLTGRALSSYTGGSSADGPRTSLPLPGSFGRDVEADDAPRTGDRTEDRTEEREGGGTTDGPDAGSTSRDDTAGGEPDTTGVPDVRRPVAEEPPPATDSDREEEVEEPVSEPTSPDPVEPAPEPEPEPQPVEPEPEPEETAEPAPSPAATPAAAPSAQSTG